MKLGKMLLMVLAVFAVGFLVIGGCVYSGYNKAITLDENVKTQWAQVEVQLQRRYDLIPNLIETVKGFAKQEKDIFLGVAKARKAYTGAATVSAKAKAASRVESALGSALSRLLVIRERYPELKSNQTFRDLMTELEGAENRLSVERKRYNDAVHALNVYTRQLFGRVCCGLAGVEPAEYFEIDEAAREAPDVDFSEP